MGMVKPWHLLALLCCVAVFVIAGLVLYFITRNRPGSGGPPQGPPAGWPGQNGGYPPMPPGSAPPPYGPAQPPDSPESDGDDGNSPDSPAR